MNILSVLDVAPEVARYAAMTTEHWIQHIRSQVCAGCETETPCCRCTRWKAMVKMADTVENLQNACRFCSQFPRCTTHHAWNRAFTPKEAEKPVCVQIRWLRRVISIVTQHLRWVTPDSPKDDLPGKKKKTRRITRKSSGHGKKNPMAPCIRYDKWGNLTLCSYLHLPGMSPTAFRKDYRHLVGHFQLRELHCHGVPLFPTYTDCAYTRSDYDGGDENEPKDSYCWIADRYKDHRWLQEDDLFLEGRKVFRAAPEKVPNDLRELEFGTPRVGSVFMGVTQPKRGDLSRRCYIKGHKYLRI